jgi:hypothetical protein
MDPASIAAISSGAVALATIAASLVRQRSTLRHARQLSDLQSMRTILDEAAAALHEVEYVLNALRSYLARFGRAFARAEERAKVYAQLATRGRELDRLLERLKIMLGPEHPAVAAFEDADQAVLEIHRALEQISGEPETHSIPGRDREADERYDERRDKIAAERETFDRMRAEFIATAQRAAGVHLPAGRSRRRRP